jgi:hypothetical protein
MRFQRASLETCGTATGVVVAIDVLRAFSTAAYAFAAGARDITLVSTVEEALALRERSPELRLMGEANGLRIPGFDFSNSPADVAAADLRGASWCSAPAPAPRVWCAAGRRSGSWPPASASPAPPFAIWTSWLQSR